jgi:ribosomal protein L20
MICKTYTGKSGHLYREVQKHILRSVEGKYGEVRKHIRRNSETSTKSSFAHRNRKGKQAN